MRVSSLKWPSWKALPTYLAVLAAFMCSLPSPALSFQLLNRGKIEARLDSTLSYGAAWRVKKSDEDLIGIANGGKATNVNLDDGNLNYDKGMVSNVFKITSELDVSYNDRTGVFLRGSAFYDIENKDGDREKVPLSDAALDLVGSDAELLDAFWWGNFDLGTLPVQVRVGEQVISWGESTFIQNSINTINPIYVSAIRLPGAELREALLPEGLVWASLGLTDNLSVEGLYLYDWDKTDIDPTGSYFSSNDFIGDGGTFLTVGDGFFPEGTGLSVPGPPLTVARNPDREPGDSGQFGISTRLIIPALNDAEFGLYYLNYHSRLPIVSALAAMIPGVPASASYLAEFPEDIQLLGLGASAEIGGVAVQGEISHRLDMPLQIDDAELFKKALGTPSQIPGTFAPGELISGYISRDVTQVQTTLTKVLGPTLGTSSIILVGEAAVLHVHDMPSKNELKLDVPGHPPIGNIERYADPTSWGYRALAKFEFSNVIGAINITPRIAWAHDVNGNSPGPGGSFMEGRKAATVGLEFDYQSNWQADIAYTDFFGADNFNQLTDRDLIAFSLKYSF